MILLRGVCVDGHERLQEVEARARVGEQNWGLPACAMAVLAVGGWPGYSGKDDRYEEQLARYNAFVADELYPYISSASTARVRVLYSGHALTDLEIQLTVRAMGGAWRRMEEHGASERHEGSTGRAWSRIRWGRFRQ